MIRLKDSVRCPRVLMILAAVSNAAEQLGLHVEVYVTSANDSQHMPHSRHYSDEALDFRTHGLATIQQVAWRNGAQQRLGPMYQAILEDIGD